MGKLALVTGASAGIGLHLAQELARRGHDVVGVGASDRIEGLGRHLPGVQAFPVQADLSTPEGVQTLWERVQDLRRPLDVVALNAGRSLGGSFLDTDLEDELHLLDLNVVGQVRLAKHVVRAMAARGSGRILVTASLSALTPTPYESIYGSIYGPTRAFMRSFAHGLREEMKEHGVSVTALPPGATATDFHHVAGMDNTVFGSDDWKNDPAQVAAQGVEALFAGRAEVVGGNAATRRAAALNRVLPEPTKAHRFARDSRPS